MSGLAGGVGVGLALGWLAGGRVFAGHRRVRQLLPLAFGLLVLVGEATVLAGLSTAAAAAVCIIFGIVLHAAWLRYLTFHIAKAHKDWRPS